MIARYTYRLKKKLRVADHWPIKIDGAIYKLMEDADGYIDSIEIEISGVCPSNSPAIEKGSGRVAAKITARDKVGVIYENRLRRALKFVQPYFHIEIDHLKYDVQYEAENDQERDLIQGYGFKFDRSAESNFLQWDIFTRALISSAPPGPLEFVSKFICMSRQAYAEKSYIVSFMHSFLLFEFMYGGGKFKTRELKGNFLASEEFVEIIQRNLENINLGRNAKRSKSRTFLEGEPTIEEFIDHILERRGHYFHGNMKKGQPWHPEKPEEADDLAFLCLFISTDIGQIYANEIFREELGHAHFEQAKEGGYIVTHIVQFRYWPDDERPLQDGEMHINVPGTKPSPKMAQYVAKKFFADFENKTPQACLKEVVAKDKKTGAVIWTYNAMEF